MQHKLMNRFLKLILGTAVIAVLNFALMPDAGAQNLGSLTTLLGQLGTTSKASGDSTLISLAGDLASKAHSFSSLLGDNSVVQGQLIGALQSMLSGNGVASLGAFSKLSEAKLTSEQMKLAKDVGNVGSAYLVQKNLAALEGSQSDVAQIVNSLRKGSPAEAIPAIQSVALNAKLTPAQKELASTLAAQYAPEVKKIGDALQEGLKSLSGFGK